MVLKRFNNDNYLKKNEVDAFYMYYLPTTNYQLKTNN